MVKQIVTNFSKHKTVFHNFLFFFFLLFLLFMSMEFDKCQKSVMPRKSGITQNEKIKPTLKLPERKAWRCSTWVVSVKTTMEFPKATLWW